jgi:uncharacterized membrane protein
MPVDSILVSVAVLSIFVIFAAVLVWADFHSRPIQQHPIGGNKKRRSF